jgi:quinol monooxygenase YgiN
VITEIAIFTAVPGKEEELGQAMLRGIEVIRQHPACISARVERCIEQPERYLLMNIWTSLEAHVKDFRSSPLFQQWRGHIAGLYQDQPSVFHYQPF